MRPPEDPRIHVLQSGEYVKVGFIAGERGIGKSSLASFIRSLCEREGEGAMAGCHVFLGGTRNLNEMMRKIFDKLLKESIDKPWYKKTTELFGNRIRSFGLFGVNVELDLQEQDLWNRWGNCHFCKGEFRIVRN